MPDVPVSFEELVERARASTTTGDHAIPRIVGSPGSGKATSLSDLSTRSAEWHRFGAATDSGCATCPWTDSVSPTSNCPAPIEPAARLIVTEGNYLLLEVAPWTDVRSLMTEVWYYHADERRPVSQLARRHVEFGKLTGDAQEWVKRHDGQATSRAPEIGR